ncbi:MAG: hypothetical protein ABSG82_01770 [Sedimentisphaerales bacterium]|jgi:hypothetical protein
MRKSVLWVAGALIPGFAAGWVLAQEQGDANRGGNETTTMVVRQNLKPQEPNIRASDVNKQDEQSRRQVQELVRKLTQEHRQKMQMQQQAAIRAGSEARYGMPADANAPIAMRHRGEPNGRGRTSPAELGARNVNPQQRLAVLEQQMSYEEAKHKDRLARLNRIRELAKQQDNTEIVGRVDKLLEEEQQLYIAKTQRIEHRKSMIAGPSGKTSPDRGGNETGDGRNRDSNRPGVGDK